jgi:V/A-type H+-transporting ATPase subunit C
MRSRLFTRADYENMLVRSDIEALISSLAKTPYQKDIETALIRVGKNRCVIEAVRQNFTRTLNQIRGFYEGDPLALIDLLRRRWDKHNLLTILRGQSREVPSIQVLAATIPAGQLDEGTLRELARQPGLRATIDLMTTWNLPYARPLRQVQSRRGATPDLDQLELALNQYYYHSLLEVLGPGDKNQRILRERIQTEIDLVNLRTTLRLVRMPGVTALVKQRYSATSVRPLFNEPGGFLPVSGLVELVSTTGTIEQVVRHLSGTRYGSALEAGWQRYQGKGGNFTMFERELERWQAASDAALFARDPLSIAIPIGYLGCKEVEISNMRLISQAVFLDLDRDSVRPDLIILNNGSD